MLSTRGKYRTFDWATSNGSVIKRRAYLTLGGAIRHAEQRSADAGIYEVSICAPVDHDTKFGPRIGAARKGKYTHTDQETAIMASTASKTDAADAGVDVKQAKPAKGKAKPAKVVERVSPGKAAKWSSILAMSDVAITKVDPGQRPNPKTLDGMKLPTDPYSTAVINFMTGNRKHPAQACIWKLTSLEGLQRRNKVRQQIGVHVGVKKSDIRFDKPGKRTTDMLAPSAGGPTKKPKAKPAAKPAPVKAAAKPAAKKPAAKKATAAAAAKKPSVSTKVTTNKKRGK